MSDFYTEADYENSVIELFQNMGYRYVYALNCMMMYAIICLRLK